MTTEQEKESRLVIERLARGENVEWEAECEVYPNGGIYSRTACYSLEDACHFYGEGQAIRLKPPEKSIYQIAYEQGKVVQLRNSPCSGWTNWQDYYRGIVPLGCDSHEWRILEPESIQHKKAREEAEAQLPPDPYAPWREKKKRCEKFEYRTWGYWEDGSKCMFLPEIKYEFRDFIPHGEWKEKFDNGVKLQYRIPWSNTGEWFELNYGGDWCELKDVEFRESPVKEPFPLGLEDIELGTKFRDRDRELMCIGKGKNAVRLGVDLVDYEELKKHWERLVNNEWLPCEK